MTILAPGEREVSLVQLGERLWWLTSLERVEHRTTLCISGGDERAVGGYRVDQAHAFGRDGPERFSSHVQTHRRSGRPPGDDHVLAVPRPPAGQRLDLIGGHRLRLPGPRREEHEATRLPKDGHRPVPVG